MKTAKEILIEAFHAGRRFGNGTFPIQTFDEWYESNDIEAKVKNLAQPDVSRSFRLTHSEQEAFEKSGSKTIKFELGCGIGMGVSYKNENGKWKDITDYGSW